MTPSFFHHYNLDHLIQDKMRECAKDRALQWNENYITIELLKSLKNYFLSYGSSVKSSPNRRSILLELYKNKGKIENRFGDITFFVRRYIGKTYVDGVGFCEAKREFDNNELQSLDYNQLIRMNSNVANHKLLLYLLQYNNSVIAKRERMNIYPIYNASYLACTVPSINAITIRSSKAFDLIDDSIPLSYQILGKYIEGFDLVYDHRTLSDVMQGKDVGSILVYIIHGYTNQIESDVVKLESNAWSIFE